MSVKYNTDLEYQARISQLEGMIDLLKRQIAQEVSEKYAAYQRIADLQEQLARKS